MMTRYTHYLLGVIALLALGIASPAYANEYDYNPFNADTHGVYIAGQAGWGMPSDDLDDDGTYALSVGYQFAPNIRAEIEGGYRTNDYSSGVVSGDADTWSLMLNGFYDFKNDSRFTPYLGAGIGWAHSNLDGAVGGVGFDESDDAFAYQLGAGVSYALTESTALTADYRWFDTSDFDYDAGATTVEEDYSAHEIRAGLRYTF